MATMTRTRTDIHRPSAEEFDPQAYEFRGCFDLHFEEGNTQERMAAVQNAVNQGYRFTSESAGTCGHCGAGCRYVALMIHPATKGMIYVGETCLSNRFELTQAEFRNLRKESSLNRERRKKSDRIEEILSAMSAEVRAAYDWANSRAEVVGIDPDKWGPGIAGDKNWEDCNATERAARTNRGWAKAEEVAWNIKRYVKPLSEKQEAFLVKLHTDYIGQEAKKAEESAKVASGELKPVPSGRVEITGEILSTKWVDNDFGGSYKMTVRDDRGFKVYGTCPSSLQNTDRGVRVTFTARCEPSDNDPMFGFFSRPTKAVNV